MRSHLRNPTVIWNTALGGVLVEVEAMFFFPEQAKMAVCEEIGEVTAVLLADWDELRVEVLDVRQVES